MPKFGKKSLELRGYLCKDLKRLVDEAIKVYDFSIVCSFRDKKEQEDAFLSKVSKAHFGQSAHNYHPSFALDAYPYPCPYRQDKGILILNEKSIEWNKMIDVFKSVASKLDIKITCGIDFKSFRDAPHIEIADWRERIKEI